MQNQNAQPVLRCENLSKSYQESGTELTIFNGINFEVQAGESVAIIGSSGAGKTTLLNLLGGLDSPTSGAVFLNGENLHLAKESKRSQIRNREMGFVYQFHHLLPEFTALENVCMPLLIGGSLSEGRQRAEQLLIKVGLKDRLKHKPSQLSGGERQRVAIARALVNNPSLVLMDEPTGNLDEATAQRVQEVLWQLVEEFSTSFVIVTHDSRVASELDKVCKLEGGLIKPWSVSS